MSSDLLQKAESAHRRGDLLNAEQLYRQLLREESTNASALFGLGTLAMQRGKHTHAADLLLQAAKIEPDAADISLNLALALQRSGQLQAATVHALHSAKLASGDEHFANVIGKLLLDLRQPRAALDLLRSCTPSQLSTTILIGRAMGALGDWDRAVALLRTLAESNNDNPDIAVELSLAAGKLRDYPLAIASYQQYMTLIEPTAQDYLRFADLYLIARDTSNSDRQLRLAREAGITGADYHVLRGRLDRLSGDMQSAQVNAVAALGYQPDHGQAWSLRIESANDTDLEDSVAALSLELADETSAATPYYRTLMLYAVAAGQDRLGDLTAAAQAFNQANALQMRALADSSRTYDIDAESTRTERLKRQHRTQLKEACVSQYRPIFIVGMPRSGTTLIEKVISRLAGVTPGGENEALTFIAAQYQRDVMTGRLPEPEGLSPSQWQDLASRYIALSPGANNIFTDKMPHNFQHVGLILGMFPHARVIQMRREPRDNCLSIYQRPFPEGHNYACDAITLGHAWCQAQGLMDYWVELDPTKVKDQNFADFVDNPEEASKALADFCQLPWHPECLISDLQDNPSFTFSELQVRSSISNTAVGRWQRYAEVMPEFFAALAEQGCLER
ncbi:sulfotransferase family protein [Halieaceae bacterium IMCC8485]|uniref:Sulfotransferase family protein n=1 Tax=Candidatus Seongchinamella marina TaxID=2518990 RepID=A0ABT3SUK2_9GAMM|nr:tetratricopeptide repeat-containing sulfotransferase family protein [Candidatus Seongchinamella marina]MCX2973620.1 sulfotransferase family protein [Candidatus Seongchinamella marina]